MNPRTQKRWLLVGCVLTAGSLIAVSVLFLMERMTLEFVTCALGAGIVLGIAAMVRIRWQ